MKEDAMMSDKNDKIKINDIIGCAFRICFIYFMKCFLPVISIGRIKPQRIYEHDIWEQISILRKLLDSEIVSKDVQVKAINHCTNNCITHIENKKTNTEQVKEKHETSNNVQYTLKVKKIGKTDPDPSDFSIS